MRITIAIVCKNRLLCLPKCIDSIQKQTNKNFDLIVVDNESTDGTVDYLKSNLIPFIISDGFIAKCRNKAIEFCKTSHILFVDSDMILPSNLIQLLYSKLHKHKKDVVYIQRSFTELKTCSKAKTIRFYNSEDAGTHSCLFNTKQLKKIKFSNQFNSSNRFRGEDWELLNRLYLLGVHFYKLKDVTTFHIEHDRSDIGKGEDYYYKIKNSTFNYLIEDTNV